LIELGQVLRFATVGAFQNAMNVATFAGLHAVGVAYRLAAVLAALAALLVSFVMNHYWTFTGSASGRLGGYLLRYSLVFGTAVFAGIVLLTVQVEMLAVPPIPAQAIAIVIVAPLSFYVQRRWVFRRA